MHVREIFLNFVGYLEKMMNEMKTFLRRKAIYVVAILFTVGGLTSCDGSAWAQILLPVISELLNPGGYNNTMQFSGTARMEMYNYNSEKNTFDKDSRKTADVPTVITVAYNDSISQIKATDLSVGGQQVKQLDFATYFDPTTLTIGPEEEYLTGGICTFNGAANTALDAACFSGKITNQTLGLTTIYFTIGNKLFKGTFQGTQMQTGL